MSFEDRAAPTAGAIARGDFDPQGINSTDFAGTPGMQAANAGWCRRRGRVQRALGPRWCARR
jgi:hypothetical protein